MIITLKYLHILNECSFKNNYTETIQHFNFLPTNVTSFLELCGMDWHHQHDMHFAEKT